MLAAVLTPAMATIEATSAPMPPHADFAAVNALDKAASMPT